MIVHFILSGETLESISEEINLENPKYLKEFHNTHCAKEDFIYDELIPRKKLLIPDLNKIKEYNSKNDAPFKNPKLNPVLPFKPENFSKIFSVKNIQTEERDNDKKTNILTYTVSVKWIEKENNFHIFHLFKNNFSDQQGSMMADLASECIRSLNPIVVKTNEKGEVIYVSLSQETIDNFEKIKAKLTDLFPDKYAAIYINEFSFAVLNKDLFNERMQKDVFIKTYFASVRNSFFNGKFYLAQSIGEENMKIEIQQKVDSENYTDEIILNQNSQPQTDSNFKGKYILDTEKGLVNNIEISHSISQFGVTTNSVIEIKELS
ncbi:hypothetical protein ASG22_04640 [Chryseobacterium sp. Leaf405]|uniref:hypothetical protein n=1 Tax=Chryseobacterium sp. Leaf405 TaxID=1736367 RepID=UPI0006FCF98A|nr:hypothetical protein [Chryseobacterium sp. Leaf405]KQT25986.1 hypothetical protein ASG22_04640 [Chryseobacterium sp. Leaf405]